MHDAECKMLREVGLQDSNIKSKGFHLVIHGSKPRYHDCKGGLNGFKLVVHMNLGLIEHGLKRVACICFFNFLKMLKS